MKPRDLTFSTLSVISLRFLAKYLIVKSEMLNTNPPPAPPPAGDILPIWSW
ncbi:hypothetical protein KsCSTR_23820 [Candidatus Kuenenia stuttgartiensis]|uniref:Uncharacterized protein n=1 Tax=Kuenenia stuttgartiensis TaxID=174633 RepID=Q1Q3Q7_KUEST|nr:hypothetical protein KsCSTR_23820 [Candidatus Kuenenia stuttgartiensis]CAJ74654.1 unknown protein [Candidatus Kuenenia stuttgartiensis]